MSKTVAMNQDSNEQQDSVCRRFGVTPIAYGAHLKVGIAQNVREGVLPINGVRVAAEGDTTGWYIWAGAWSDDPDFFLPLHVEHLIEWCPMAYPYLMLPVGWRFQVAPGYEDVWIEPSG